ncbi:cell division septation protein DedD [Pseudorhodoferax soli]|uniref:Cell division septation protein DedD n=2 Tax=Pseudorhodoferax soli TaxID=545864 RepID=A0A368XTK7_9BURK|nr:cell division septation protein DedD [Pseudorhodoferax soli]
MLYRAAIGPDRGDHYLRRFQARDGGNTQAPRWPRWHWGGFVSALSWLAWRGLIGAAALWAGAALLGAVLALGLARLVFGAGAAPLAWLLAVLTLAASLAWGLGAERLYHRLCNRRILAAVAAHASIGAACAALQRQQPGRAARWATLLALHGAVLAALAGLVLAMRPLPQQPPSERLAPGPQAAALAPATSAAPTAALLPMPNPGTEGQPAPAPAPLASTSAPAEPAEPAGPPAPAQAASAAATAAPAAPPLAASVAASAARPGRAAQAAPDPAAGRYAVQIGVFAEPANAQAALDRLRAAGLPARGDAAGPPGRLRVRAGPFATREEAQRAGERIQALGLPAVLVRLPAARQAGPAEP